MEIIGSGQGVQSYKLISPLDIYERHILQEYIPRTPRASALSWMKALKGRWSKRTTPRHVYSFYEKGNWLKAAAKIASVTPSGAKFIITLDASSHESLNGTNNVSYPTVDNLVVFQDGITQGYVEAVDRSTPGAHAVTVQKTDASMDIASIATVGSTMVFYSNVKPEASKKGEGRVPRFEKVTNKIHTIRQDFPVTDWEMQNRLEFPVENGSQYLFYEGLMETGDRFEIDIETACLIGPNSDGLTNAEGEDLQTMYGAIPQIRDEGNTFKYFNRPDYSDFQQLNLGFKASFGDKKYLMGYGQQIRQAASTWLLEFSKAGTGNIDFTAIDRENGSTKAVEIGLEAIYVDGYSYFFQEWDVFSHPTFLGADGMPFNDMGVLIPLGVTKNYDVDGTMYATGQKSTEPYCQMIYSPPQFAAKHVRGDHAIWQTGAMADDGATNDVVEKWVHMQGYYGWEMRCRNKFGLWEKAA